MSLTYSRPIIVIYCYYSPISYSNYFTYAISSVQVRRTDKINTEAAFHSIEEYMYWVDLYYNKLEKVQVVEKRRVYLATDDGNLLPEAKMK